MSEENQQENKPDQESKPQQVLIKIDQNGLFAFENQMELASAARLAIQMNIVPAHLKKEGLEAVMSALTLCRQYKLPNHAMNEMAFIKGKLSCFGSLVTALAERHPEYGEQECFFVDKDSNKICSDNKNLKEIPWAHVRKIKKKNSTVWNEYVFSVDDAFQAGLLTEKTSSDSGWVKYTKDLLSHKTKARGFKDNYASALHGIEYYEDIKEVNQPRDVTNTAEVLNNL